MRRLGFLVSWVLLALVSGAWAQDNPRHTDAELRAMAKIHELGGLAMEIAQTDRRLDVSFQQVEHFSEDSLLLLRDLRDVAQLNLRGLNVTDRGLVHLKDLTSLTWLHLELTKVTDRGLENLKGLTHLEYLNLYGTGITDAGLAHLVGLKNLRHLYLWQTKVTDAGVARLKSALPEVEIVRGLDLKPPAESKAEKKSEKKDGEKKPEKKQEPSKKK